MRKLLACIPLVVAILSAGCGPAGGASGIEADMKRSGDELRKVAAAMSVEELQKKMDEIEKYGKELEKSGDEKADSEKAVKLMEVRGVYGGELTKRTIK